MNSNGSFRASPSNSIGCHSHAFGVALAQNTLYVASSCMENRGMFCYKQTVRNASGFAGDTCTWNELPERILTNNTDDCGKVHVVWQFSWKSRLRKYFLWQKMLFNAWQEQGFKDKQMVVKLSCNNRLQCVQNLTLYSFVVQLLVSWLWSLRQVAGWCSRTPSVDRRRKTKRKSFIQRKLSPESKK